MATKNFTQFDLRTPLLTSDYIVGYKTDGSAEYKATIKQIVDLVGESDSQTLSFNENTKDLEISSGNTVSLSSLSDTAFSTASSSFATNTNLNAVSSLLTPLTLTNTLTSQLVPNTNFNSYKTEVASATATLLPTTIYQNASGNLESAFTITQQNTATDSFDLSYTGTLPPSFLNAPVYTTQPLRDALIGSTGTQAATYRDGKWVTGLTVIGFNNPTLDTLESLSSTNIAGIRDSISFNSLTKLKSISFPSLASVGGSVTCVGGTNMNSVSAINFPSLASIGGSFTGVGASGQANSLKTINFPSLVSVGGGFTGAASNSQANNLPTINFPSLASIGGNFTGGGNMNSISAINFPSLVSIGGFFQGFSTGSANNLITISFPSLASIGGLFQGTSFSSLFATTTIDFPSLASVGGTFTLAGGNSSVGNITTINFPSLALVNGGFIVATSGTGSLVNLTTLLFGPTLKHINGDFSTNNVALDRHNTWLPNTYYSSYSITTAPASAFTSTGTTVSATIINHGYQNGDQIIVSGFSGSTLGIHNYNTTTVATVTSISTDIFIYGPITATTIIPTGTATIQRIETAVTPVTKNGRKYICTGAGTSLGTEPVWPTTIGQTVTDGTVTWTCSEMSLPNILSRLDALSGTNDTITYGANRFISIVGPTALATVNSISTTAGIATITTAAAHNLTTGTQITVTGCTGTALRYNGIWTVGSTGTNTLTANVPADLNSVAGAGTMRLTNACPQYTGSLPVSATTVTGISADSHMIFSATQLLDSPQGTAVPVFVAGLYNRNGTTNGFAKYSCTENGWDMWYDTTLARWALTPSTYTGQTSEVANYGYTNPAVPLASTSSANPAVITSSSVHGVATGAVFTVAISGCSNTALNGSWTATSTGTTTFTIPADGSGGATTNSGTVAVLNQQFNQGLLISASVPLPVQGVLQTITCNNHGFSNGDFAHFYGAVGTGANATSINDLNTSALVKSVTTNITVVDANTFTLVRYANTQPLIGSYTLTTMPHIRKPSINDVAYHTVLKLRARGVAASVIGTTGI